MFKSFISFIIYNINSSANDNNNSLLFSIIAIKSSPTNTV